jgi:hypothetical protein
MVLSWNGGQRASINQPALDGVRTLVLCVEIQHAIHYATSLGNRCSKLGLITLRIWSCLFLKSSSSLNFGAYEQQAKVEVPFIDKAELAFILKADL